MKKKLCALLLGVCLAIAYDRALWMTRQLLAYEPYRPTDAVIEEMYRRWVNNFIQNYAGTANRTGSRSPLIIIKNAQYTFLGNGNCD